MISKEKPLRISVWASGNGSNAENLYSYFQKSNSIKVAHILTNNNKAGVIQRMEKFKVPVTISNNNLCSNAEYLLSVMNDYQIDAIVLAGYLRLLPSPIIEQFSERILNIHPALLPDFGGKGMYGHHVHEAVIASGVKESGITIHLVNENYDEGQALFQSRCSIDHLDNPESLAQKIHLLEQKYFPPVVEKYFNDFFGLL